MVTDKKVSMSRSLKVFQISVREELLELFCFDCDPSVDKAGIEDGWMVLNVRGL